MTHKSYVRNGHWVEIDVEQNSRGYWSWSYTIDGVGYTAMEDRPLKNEGALMLEAEHHANSRVDRMPTGTAEE
ncbi:hypothetical protein [Burkholderia gladioli]|uniref:hypothetical protein n=1 Tax=Burkholderia gladioli TaxID=28095 RepID=UPI00163DEBFA|nr:hypothetical protein [Burkholderia gladioli]